MCSQRWVGRSERTRKLPRRTRADRDQGDRCPSTARALRLFDPPLLPLETSKLIHRLISVHTWKGCTDCR